MVSADKKDISFDTLDKIDEILRERYPEPEELIKFPLGEKLQKLDRMVWTNEMRCIELDSSEIVTLDDQKITKILRDKSKILKHESIINIFRNHITECIEGIRILTTGGPYISFFKEEEYKSGKEPYKGFETSLTKFDDYERKFLRVITLYHDIGKVIHRDKHPMLGKHLLESLDENDRKRIIHIFGDESYFYSMLDLIGHHDLFGTFSTGEASKTAFIEASGLRLRKIDEAKRIINYLVILNLADIYGTIGPLSEEMISMIMNDWTYFNEMIPSDKRKKSSLLSKSELENKIIESEQEPEKTTERLKRIIIGGIRYGTHEKIKSELRPLLCNKITDDLIRSSLIKQLGPELQNFCRDFALVCKLDYTLRFMKSLCNAWILKNKPKLDDIENIRLESLVNIILEVLTRLVRCYSDLTRQRDGGWRRVGLELLGISRSKEISEQVIELLLSDRKSEGINWIADEITAWYYPR